LLTVQTPLLAADALFAVELELELRAPCEL
jgi:hypothetical protein